MPELIRVLGEPTYRLEQRFSVIGFASNTVPAAQSIQNFDLGNLMTAPLQQTQALRLVSGWASMENFDGDAPGQLTVSNWVFQVRNNASGRFIRQFVPEYIPSAVAGAGPVLRVIDDEFILGSDYAETGSVSSGVLELIITADFINLTVANRQVAARCSVVFELYNRETITRPVGGGGGGNGGGTLQACPPPGQLLPDGECWIPIGLEALHP